MGEMVSVNCLKMDQKSYFELGKNRNNLNRTRENNETKTKIKNFK